MSATGHVVVKTYPRGQILERRGPRRPLASRMDVRVLLDEVFRGVQGRDPTCVRCFHNISRVVWVRTWREIMQGTRISEDNVNGNRINTANHLTDNND